MAIAQSFPLSLRVPVRTHWDGDVGATDLFAPVGTPVLAVFDGYAVAQDFSLGGRTVTVGAPDGSVAYSAHLRDVGYTGPVSAGQQIGVVGTTGNAQGKDPHLHFGIASSLAQLSAHNGGGDIDVLAFLSNVAPGSGTSIAPSSPATTSPGDQGHPIVFVALAALALLVLRPR